MLCVSGSLRGSVTASADSKGIDCVSSAARSCGDSVVAAEVHLVTRVAVGCDAWGKGATGCSTPGCGVGSHNSTSFGVIGRGATISLREGNPSAPRGASVNLRIGSTATNAIISGLAVLSAAREAAAGGNVAEADSPESGPRCPGKRETGAL
jgi:hypothetical protein